MCRVVWTVKTDGLADLLTVSPQTLFHRQSKCYNKCWMETKRHSLTSHFIIWKNLPLFSLINEITVCLQKTSELTTNKAFTSHQGGLSSLRQWGCAALTCNDVLVTSLEGCEGKWRGEIGSQKGCSSMGKGSMKDKKSRQTRGKSKVTQTQTMIQEWQWRSHPSALKDTC